MLAVFALVFAMLFCMGKWCTVTVTDGEGKRYSVDVNAESSYDAAHLYLTHGAGIWLRGGPDPCFAR